MTETKKQEIKRILLSPHIEPEPIFLHFNEKNFAGFGIEKTAVKGEIGFSGSNIIKKDIDSANLGLSKPIEEYTITELLELLDIED